MDASTTAELTIRMVLGLAVIVGMLSLGTRLVRRRVGGTANVAIDIRGRQVLSKASSVAVIQVGARHLLVGVTEHGVNLLAEGDDLVAEPTATPASGTTATNAATDPAVDTAIDLTDPADADSADPEAAAAETDPIAIDGAETGTSGASPVTARRPRPAAAGLTATLDHANVLDALRQRTVRKG